MMTKNKVPFYLLNSPNLQKLVVYINHWWPSKSVLLITIWKDLNLKVLRAKTMENNAKGGENLSQNNLNI